VDPVVLIRVCEPSGRRSLRSRYFSSEADPEAEVHFIVAARGARLIKLEQRR
jgi:hypothetical protein